MLADTEADGAAYADFLRHHWRNIWTTDRLERANKSTKRRTKIVGAFTNDYAVLQLGGAILSAQHGVCRHQMAATPPERTGQSSSLNNETCSN